MAELIEFLKEIERTFNGFTDNWFFSLLDENSSVNLDEEFDKSIKQRLAEQFENLARIPFISSGKNFKRFFDIETGATPIGYKTPTTSETGSFVDAAMIAT